MKPACWITILTLLLLSSGCDERLPQTAVEPVPETATAPPSPPAANTRQPSMLADEMQWQTDGGGAVTFRVRRNGPNFDVDVTSYERQERKDRFTITADSGEVYRALSDVMRDQGRIRLHLSDEPTGSWTTLRFSDGEHSVTFKDMTGEGDLRVIYDSIVAQIESLAR